MLHGDISIKNRKIFNFRLLGIARQTRTSRNAASTSQRLDSHSSTHRTFNDTIRYFRILRPVHVRQIYQKIISLVIIPQTIKKGGKRWHILHIPFSAQNVLHAGTNAVRIFRRVKPKNKRNSFPPIKLLILRPKSLIKRTVRVPPPVLQDFPVCFRLGSSFCHLHIIPRQSGHFGVCIKTCIHRSQ